MLERHATCAARPSRSLLTLRNSAITMNFASLVAPALEKALNAYLRLDPEIAARLVAIDGKLIGLEIVNPDISLLLRPRNNEIQVSAYPSFEPDTIIRGTPLSLARLGLTSDVAGGLSTRGIEIRGDAEVGRVFQDVLVSIEIDWEEMFAAWIGDIPAHQTGNLLRGLVGYLNSTMDKLRMDISEYLQEEGRITPTRVEIEAFMNEVDWLREEVDRLAARVQRIEGTTTSKSDPARPPEP
jgi:ubiquinone biosynthesis protein UbiJ